MKVRVMYLLPLWLCLLLASAPSAQSSDPLPAAYATVKGQMALVRLLGASRTDSASLKRDYANAPDGVTLYFFVGRMPGVSGLLSLAEPRDFNLNGQSYRKLTAKALSRNIEPSTDIQDLPDFLQQYPRLKAAIPPGFDSAYSLTVTIAGAVLPNTGKADITLELGFDAKYEKFPFSLPLSERDHP